MRSHFCTRFHAFAKKLQVLNSHAFFEYLELFGVESSQVCLSMWLRVLSELITVKIYDLFFDDVLCVLLTSETNDIFNQFTRILRNIFQFQIPESSKYQNNTILPANFKVMSNNLKLRQTLISSKSFFATQT